MKKLVEEGFAYRKNGQYVPCRVIVWLFPNIDSETSLIANEQHDAAKISHRQEMRQYHCGCCR